MLVVLRLNLFFLDINSLRLLLGDIFDNLDYIVNVSKRYYKYIALRFWQVTNTGFLLKYID